MTIAANLTGQCSPQSIIFCLRQCVFVFVLQCLVSILFSYDTGFENFQPFKYTSTFIRIMAVILMTLDYSKELYTAIKMLTFLKRQKGFSSRRKKMWQRGGCINISLSLMQLSVPFITVISLIIKITQENNAGQITKAFVALSIVVKIDDMFSSSLPRDVRENAKRLN
jgi:hypothetical protein